VHRLLDNPALYDARYSQPNSAEFNAMADEALWGAAIPAGPICRVFDGTSWVPGIPKVWSGSAWMPATITIY